MAQIPQTPSETVFSSNYRADPVPQQPLHYAKPLTHIEFVKDITTLELIRFFANQKQDGYITEVPTIEKYKITDSSQGQDPYVSAVNVIRQLPDINQKLPIIAITVATGRSMSLGIGGQYVGVVQESPRIQTTRGPWTLQPNTQLLFQTSAGQTLITFTPFYVADFNRVMPEEVVNAINNQSGRITAEEQLDHSILILLKDPTLKFIQNVPVPLYDYRATEGISTNSLGYIMVDHLAYSGIPLTGKNSDASSVFGITGALDNITNPLRPPMHRYHTAKDLILNMDIGTDDDNQRTELTDLLGYFWDMRLQEQDFTFLGDTKLKQNWQIITKKAMTLGGESEIPRPEGDGFAKIYVNRVSIPLISIDYIDRPAVVLKTPAYGTISLGSDRPLP